MTVDEAQHAFESKIVRHCAPTLAGVKAANLFNCCTLGGESFCSTRHSFVLDCCQSKISGGGVALSVLLQRSTGALILVYRPQAIQGVLQHEPSKDFLCAQGYDVSTPEACIESLRQRLVDFDCCRAGEHSCAQCEFPHEIGLLLGYPFEDVMGFIENAGQDHICTGAWKVYGDEVSARSAFECYEYHTRILNELFSQGTPLEDLVRLGQGVQCAKDIQNIHYAEQLVS